MDIYERLAPIMREVFEDDTLTPSPEMSAAEVEHWDSLSNIIFMTSLEESFGIKFTTSEVASLQNLGELVEVIRAKCAGAAAQAGSRG
jgi:acyl carrier protein